MPGISGSAEADHSSHAAAGTLQCRAVTPSAEGTLQQLLCAAYTHRRKACSAAYIVREGKLHCCAGTSHKFLGTWQLSVPAALFRRQLKGPILQHWTRAQDLDLTLSTNDDTMESTAVAVAAADRLSLFCGLTQLRLQIATRSAIMSGSESFWSRHQL